jgi:uncharacterized protein YacL
MSKKSIQVIPAIGIFIGLLIGWFLSSKVIDIPKGTHEGGIIGATGVFFILVCSFALIYLFAKLKKSREKSVK